MTLRWDPATFDAVRIVAATLMALAAATAWRGSRRLAAAVVVCAVLLAVGYPALSIQRPFGLFADDELTLQYARTGVAATLGDGRAEIVPLAPPASVDLWPMLAASGAPPNAIAFIIGLSPVLLLLAMALALGRLAGRARGVRFDAVTAGLWIVLSTGDLEALTGLGFLPGSWRHASAGFLIVLELVVLASLPARTSLRWRLVTGIGLAVPWLVMGRPHSAETLAAPQVVLLMTLDQGLLGLVALLGAYRGAGGGSVLLGTAAALLGCHAITGALDPWGPAVLYRAALTLVAAPVVEAGFRAVARHVDLGAGPGTVTRSVSSVALSLTILALGTGSLALWWRPERLDAAVYVSRQPLPEGMAAAMTWIRERTPAEAVFIASPGFAPAVTALGGRRVVRGRPLIETTDDDLRRRAQDDLIERCEVSDLVRRYGITHVLRGPASLWADRVPSAGDLAAKPCFKLVYNNPVGYRIFEVMPSGR